MNCIGLIKDYFLIGRRIGVFKQLIRISCFFLF